MQNLSIQDFTLSISLILIVLIRRLEVFLRICGWKAIFNGSLKNVWTNVKQFVKIFQKQIARWQLVRGLGSYHLLFYFLLNLCICNLHPSRR